MTDSPGLGCWAIVEIMGHTRLAGYVTEEQVAGATMLKIEVPAIAGDRPRDPFVRYYSAGSIFSISPCSEEHARQVVEWDRPNPTPVWLPEPAKLLPAGAVEGDYLDDDSGMPPF